jgi:hypothetical protein
MLPDKISADTFKSPDILILGDSQISFGSGPVFLDFFENIKAHCKPNATQKEDLKKLGDMSVGVIGVRSTSLQSWTARKGWAKGAVCDVDPKWKVNAGTYGFINTSGNKYVQIGRGPEYQFCEKNKSPFETMFRDDYYNPKLLLMSFMGNSARRWANNMDMALQDVQDTMRQLPPDMPCIFMTTAPAYSKKIVSLRLKAQNHLEYAFRKSGSRCTFVKGATPKTVAANLGNKHYFRVNKSGKVKDPYHPNTKAAENFFSVEMGDICSAIFEQIGTTLVSSKP